jgi:hypothetical protein
MDPDGNAEHPPAQIKRRRSGFQEHVRVLVNTAGSFGRALEPDANRHIMILDFRFAIAMGDDKTTVPVTE